MLSSIARVEPSAARGCSSDFIVHDSRRAVAVQGVGCSLAHLPAMPEGSGVAVKLATVAGLYSGSGSRPGFKRAGIQAALWLRPLLVRQARCAAPSQEAPFPRHSGQAHYRRRVAPRQRPTDSAFVARAFRRPSPGRQAHRAAPPPRSRCRSVAPREPDSIFDLGCALLSPLETPPR